MAAEPVSFQTQYEYVHGRLVLMAKSSQRAWHRVGSKEQARYSVHARIRTSRQGKDLNIVISTITRGVVVSAGLYLQARKVQDPVIRVRLAVTRPFSGEVEHIKVDLDLQRVFAKYQGSAGQQCLDIFFDAVISLMRDLGERYVR